MRWECHECGHEHASIPERCEECGTVPEIVVNIWQCTSCGQADIPGTVTSCPSCGADKQADAKVAVAPNLKLFGEVARALAEGAWRYCAYCKTLVPPVDIRSGRRNERCPACGGELSESQRVAASQQVSAAEAEKLRPQVVADLAGNVVAGAGEARVPHLLAPPADPPAAGGGKKKGGIAKYVLLAIVGLIVFVICAPTRKVDYQVTAQRWSRSIDVEELQFKNKTDWQSDVPAAAYDRSCAPKVRRYNEVPIGTEKYWEDVEDRSKCEQERDRTESVADGSESYEEQVQDGKKCVRYGFKMNGGVSVKTCEEFEPKYKTVTRTRTKYRDKVVGKECVRYGTMKVQKSRTKYRKDPVYEPFCSFTVDTDWKVTRTLRTQGVDVPPEWSDTSTLGKRERTGARHEEYVLALKDKRGNDKEFTCKTQQEWTPHKTGTSVKAEVSLGVVLRLADEP